MIIENCYLLSLMLILIVIQGSKQQGPDITIPPQNETACVGDEVNITCGYSLSISLVPVWLINRKTFSVGDIRDSSLYNSPVVANLMDTVLTVTSVTGSMNGTTFQCEFTVQPAVLSSIGTLTVFGPPAQPVINVEMRLTSLVISWDTFSHTSCSDVTYNVTLSDGTAELVEETTTTNNTISFTDLVNDTQYEVTVLAINNAGPGTVVTANVSTLTPSVPFLPTNLAVVVKFVDFNPVVNITWNPSQLALNMTAVQTYDVSLTDEDNLIVDYSLLSTQTSISTEDMENRLMVNIGRDYVVGVQSVNSIGASKISSTSFSVRWLRSATITLLSDNRTVSVLCDVNESSPPVNCSVTINCTTCEEAMTIIKVFTNKTELSVSPLNNYSISVQVIRSDGTAVEDFSIVDTFSVPESSSSGSSCNEHSSLYMITLCAISVIATMMMMM